MNGDEATALTNAKIKKVLLNQFKKIDDDLLTYILSNNKFCCLLLKTFTLK